MIQAFYDYGVRREMVNQPFLALRVSFHCFLSSDGSIRIEPFSDEPVDLPAKVARSSNLAANYMYDTTPYALGVSSKTRDRLLPQFLLFWQTTLSHAKECGDRKIQKAVKAFFDRLELPAIVEALHEWEATSGKKYSSLRGPARAAFGKALQKVLTGEALQTFTALLNGKPPALIEAAIEGQKIKGGEWVVFTLDGRQPMAMRPKAEALWVKIQRPHEDKTNGQCLLSGKSCKVVRYHDKVKGVPGTTKSGVPLVSFNQPVFRYLGLMEGDNFPVSQEAHDTYITAFRHLIDHNRVFTSPNSCLLVWAEEPEHDELVAPILVVLQSKDKEAVKAAWATLATTEGEARIHCCMLRGSVGRISILNYQVRPLNDLCRNLLVFHDEFREFEGYTPGGLFAWMLKNNTKRKDLTKAKDLAKIQTQTILAVLMGTPYPAQVLSRLVHWARDTKSLSNHFLTMTWLRAFISRMGSPQPPLKNPFCKESPMPEPQLEQYVNTLDTSRGYNLGRLVSLDCKLRRMSGVAVTEIAELRSIERSPNMYLRKSNRMEATLEALRKGSRGGHIVQIRRVVLANLHSMVGVLAKLTLLEGSDLYLGFAAQNSYNSDYSRWKYEQHKASQTPAAAAPAAATA